LAAQEKVLHTSLDTVPLSDNPFSPLSPPLAAVAGGARVEGQGWSVLLGADVPCCDVVTDRRCQRCLTFVCRRRSAWLRRARGSQPPWGLAAAQKRLSSTTRRVSAVVGRRPKGLQVFWARIHGRSSRQLQSDVLPPPLVSSPKCVDPPRRRQLQEESSGVLPRLLPPAANFF